MAKEIFIVIDSSESMNYEFERGRLPKIDIVKRGLKDYLSLLEGLQPEDRLAIMTYKTSGTIDQRPEVQTILPLCPVNQISNLRSIDQITAGGDSPMGDALKQIVEMLSEKSETTYRCIKLISDGGLNYGIDPLLLLDSIINQEITIDTIQIENEAYLTEDRSNLMHTLSEKTGGGYTLALSAKDIFIALKTTL